MSEDYDKQKRKRVILQRSIADYGMGTFFLLVGLYFFFYDELDISIFSTKPTSIDLFIGALFVLYGSWRLYRGYKKNYFK